MVVVFVDLRSYSAACYASNDLNGNSVTQWYMYLSIAAPRRAPPCFRKNCGKSVPPPKKLMRSGVRAMSMVVSRFLSQNLLKNQVNAVTVFRTPVLQRQPVPTHHVFRGKGMFCHLHESPLTEPLLPPCGRFKSLMVYGTGQRIAVRQ